MEDANQKKKLLLKAIIATVVLFVVILILFFIFKAIDDKNTKIIYGNTTFKTTTTDMNTEDGLLYQRKTINLGDQGDVPILIVTPDGKIYYCIETLCSILGYRYNKGAYSELDESTDKCHVDNGGEFVTFASDSNTIHKNIKSAKYEDELADKEERIKLTAASSNGKNSNEIVTSNKEATTVDEELINLERPVIKFADGKLYASYDAITEGLNMRIVAVGNDIQMYSLEQLEATYSSFLSEKGYTLTKNFINKRSLYNGLAVVGQNNNYGVVKIDGNTCQEVISLKYDTIEYIQSIDEFIISSESKYGMIAPGAEKPTIPLQYNNIELLDAKEKLYIVASNGKSGVVNAQGDVIIPTEYDSIGIPEFSSYAGQNLDSKYLIAGECIPVLQNGCYGLYNKKGDMIARPTYTSIGCSNPNDLINNTSAMPTVVIPVSDKLNCIVFSMESNTGNQTYGMITTDGDIVFNAYYTAIYYITSGGKTTYYFNKVNNNELYTLQELINTREELRNLIKRKSNTSKLQLDNDTEENDNQNQNDNGDQEDNRQEQNDDNDNGDNNGNDNPDEEN